MIDYGCCYTCDMNDTCEHAHNGSECSEDMTECNCPLMGTIIVLSDEE